MSKYKINENSFIKSTKTNGGDAQAPDGLLLTKLSASTEDIFSNPNLTLQMWGQTLSLYLRTVERSRKNTLEISLDRRI
jgi:hypothetical protein